jgi:hypothetical protein
MNFLLTAAAALTALFVCGCASTEGATNADRQYEDRVYRTGSNIPVRDKTSMTEEEKASRAAEAQRTMQQLQRTGAGNPNNN